jgi:hypothetical protein
VVAAASLLALSLGQLVGGCGADGSTEGKDAARKTAAADGNQAESALAMTACLVDGGIDASAEDMGDEEGQLRLELGKSGAFYHYAIGGQGQTGGGPEGLSEEDYERGIKKVEELAEQHSSRDEQDFLIVGEADHSDTWRKCLEASGYLEPVWQVDPAAELKFERRLAQAGTEWATCAREHGYPKIADPHGAVADNGQTEPTVLIPASMTVTELKSLLQACPNYDIEAHRAAVEALASNQGGGDLGDMESIDPPISVDGDCYQADGVTPAEGKCSKDELSHQDELEQVLNEASERFFEETMEDW